MSGPCVTSSGHYTHLDNRILIMEDDLRPPCRLLVMSKGAQLISTLPQLLPDYLLVCSGATAVDQADAVLAWGNKPSAVLARKAASTARLPVLTVEDGFVRSVGLGADEPPLSLVVDDLGIYYDASAPSRLEQLIGCELSEAMAQRARALQVSWQANKVSKYNAARIDAVQFDMPCVLVADQTFGDASLQGAGVVEFQAMLQTALNQHPLCKVLLKVHPDVVAGRKKGHFDLEALRNNPRIDVISRDIHPAELLPQMQAVYVMTSQLGFDALLWGVEVHTFGMPFYAGWGLTQDALPAPARRGSATLEQLIHAALVEYPRYINPETGTLCTPEVLIEWLGLQRRKRSSLPPEMQVIGFTRWKLQLTRFFFDGSSLRFVKKASKLKASAAVLTWGCKHDHELSADHPAVVRVEDGFLRSVGLGASKNRPLSWVADDLGIYYDASRPSRLEQILNDGNNSQALLERAAGLRAAICRAGLTKYNLPGSPWQRPAGVDKVILVTGQVESDASIRFGASTIRTNLQLLKAVRQSNPLAWVLYKPHPEVLAGTREQGSDERQAVDWCNQMVGDSSFDQLLSVVDEVHVLTSQSGFEALMRGIPVTTYGQPFYAGWGLTTDMGMQPAAQARRQRRLTLDELVAGTLISYPTYISRITNRFTTPEQILFELSNWHQLPKEGAPSSWVNTTGRWIANFVKWLLPTR